MKTVITIGRQFGSGGREIGVKLAKKLNIPFYDKELLQKAAEKSGLCEKIFENFDERPKSLLYSIAMDSYMFSLPGTGATDSLEQQVYLATYDAVRHLADQGSCVIIGRCADYALADYPNVLRLFIDAPLEKRIQTVAQREKLTPEKAKALIVKTDKRRAAYYEYYSSQQWGDVDSYDFCLDSGVFGLDGTVEIIEQLIARKEVQ
ncbi:MAG: cytidylate kinase-like family protein [Oscillibacter sp.]|nr:cytidylate kinase-like family protein [Oscillibacter sp.]